MPSPYSIDPTGLSGLLNHNLDYVELVHARHNQSKLCFCSHLITTFLPFTI